MSTVISWTDMTWNPVTGCSRVSDGCRNCYAERLSLKWAWSEHPWTANHAADNVVLHPERLGQPYRWRAPRRVLVNSMSDLFHPLIPDSYLADVFAVMAATSRHTYQILTKRPERAATWPGPWPTNIWLGTSVEDARVLHRVPTLAQSHAAVRFLSSEPLIGPLGRVDLTGIRWVIVGGESGPGFRPMDHVWAREIRDQCVAAGVAFFFKQSAAYRTEQGKALLEADGSARIWQQFPAALAQPSPA